MKNIETKCITHAPTLLSHKGSAAWAIALKYVYICACFSTNDHLFEVGCILEI